MTFSVIALTGGIASGKSTVSAFFKKRGVEVVDADVLARAAVEPGTQAYAAIEKSWPQVLNSDKSLNREKLGHIVFGNPQERATLNTIVHPEVARLAAEAFARIESTGARFCLYDVPLYFENKLQTLFPKCIVVWVPKNTQIERLMRRSGLTEKEAEQRLAAQESLDSKKERATWVIDNSLDLETTENQVETLAATLAKLES